MAALRRPEIGAQDEALLTGDPAKRNALLDALKRGGAKYVRSNVVYGKTNGGRDLVAFDGLVDAARQRGLRVQATIMGDPKYAEQTEGNLSYANQDPKLMAEFARRVAQHEGGRVSRYSIGNEPNYPAFAKDADTKVRQAGRQYRDLYRSGRAAIKGVTPGAEVMIGELSNSPNAVGFLKSLLAGKPLKTEGFAMHPYVSDGAGFDINHLDAVQSFLAQAKQQGRLQTVKGQQAPLFLTEFGFQRGDMPEEQRQRALANAYAKAKKAKARQLLYYQLSPTVRDPGAPATPDMVDYGGSGQAGRAADSGWKWDTAVSPTGDPADVERLVRSLTRGAAPRTARRRASGLSAILRS